MQAVQSHRQAFESFLQRDLRPQGTWRGASSVREFHQLFAGRPRGRASIACAERGGVPGNMYFGEVGGPFCSFAHVTLIHQRAAVPGAKGARVSGQRDEAGRVETFDEE